MQTFNQHQTKKAGFSNLIASAVQTLDIKEKRKSVQRKGFGNFGFNQQEQGSDAEARGINTTIMPKLLHNFGDTYFHAKSPVPLRAKLAVNTPGDKYEQEADAVADMVMGMTKPGSVQRRGVAGNEQGILQRKEPGNAGFAISPMHGNLFNTTGANNQAISKLETSMAADGSPGEIISPTLINEVIGSSGRPLEDNSRSFFESGIGYNFGHVRIHTDEKAARSAKSINALAYTVGKDIVFGSGQYNAETVRGKRLLAHELTHVIQQGNQLSVQRTGEGLGTEIQPLTMNSDIYFNVNKPAINEMNAPPSLVLTSSGVSSLNAVKAGFQINQNLLAELEGYASIEGNPNYNYDLSVRRTHYIAQLIGIGRVRDIPGKPHSLTKVEDGIYCAGSSNARANIDPADRRVHVAQFTPPTITRPPLAGSNSTLGNNSTPPGRNAGTSPSSNPNSTETGSNQYSVQGGIGGVGHAYLSTPSSTEPAREAIIQVVAAYTRQFHRDNSRGLELQIPVQLQISLTTGTVSLAGGGQLSYVIPFGRNMFQWSAFVQVLLGSPLSSPSLQFQPAVGTQLTFSPVKWLQLGTQASAGSTLQTNGTNSVDYSGVFTITWVH